MPVGHLRQTVCRKCSTWYTFCAVSECAFLFPWCTYECYLFKAGTFLMEWLFLLGALDRFPKKASTNSIKIRSTCRHQPLSLCKYVTQIKKNNMYVYIYIYIYITVLNSQVRCNPWVSCFPSPLISPPYHLVWPNHPAQPASRHPYLWKYMKIHEHHHDHWTSTKIYENLVSTFQESYRI